AHQRSCPLQSFRKTVFVKWLQQVIERIYFKRAQRILFIRCYEDDAREHRTIQRFQDLEAVHARHLNIQKNEIRMMPPYFGNSRLPVTAFCNNLDFRLPLEKTNQPAERKRLIFNYDHFHPSTPEYFCCGISRIALNTPGVEFSR